MGRLSLDGFVALTRQGSIEPCGSGQQSAIQNPETSFMASSSRELITPQPPSSVRHHVSTKIVQMEVGEWKVTSFRVCASPKLASTKITCETVSGGGAVTRYRYIMAVDPGGNSLNINYGRLISISKCPQFDRIPETLAYRLTRAAVRHREHDGNTHTRQVYVLLREMAGAQHAVSGDAKPKVNNNALYPWFPIQG